MDQREPHRPIGIKRTVMSDVTVKAEVGHY